MTRPHRAVVIACTASKLEAAAYVHELYTGVVWAAWRRVMPSALPNGWSLWALSAEHGLVESHRRIEPYNRRLDPVRASELAPVVARQWERHAEWLETWEPCGGDVEVAVIGGDDYQGLAKLAGLPVTISVTGATGGGTRGGIGMLRRRTDRFARMAHHGLTLAPGNGIEQWSSWRDAHTVGVQASLPGLG